MQACFTLRRTFGYVLVEVKPHELAGPVGNMCDRLLLPEEVVQQENCGHDEQAGA